MVPSAYDSAGVADAGGEMYEGYGDDAGIGVDGLM